MLDEHKAKVRTRVAGLVEDSLHNLTGISMVLVLLHSRRDQGPNESGEVPASSFTGDGKMKVGL